MALGWYGTSDMPHRGWTCGYCGRKVGGNVGFHRGYSDSDMSDKSKIIYICPHCQNPTAFVREGDDVVQVPGAPYGSDVDGLPDDVETIYLEVRRCIQYTAYTAAVLGMRGLLSHIAVDLGAEGNKSFNYYVSYLDEHHYITPNARGWVDILRSFGNEVTHELRVVTEGEAKRMLDFAEMLLRIVYEFPARAARR